MKFKKLFLTTIVLFVTTIVCSQPKVIAHRGFWKIVNSAQNSISSLNKADSIHCYGSEFDVWISVDGKLIVNHDSTYQGIRIETSKYKNIKKLKLANGENIPSLKAYLKQAKKLNVEIVLEVKTHNNLNRQNTAIDAILKLVKKMKLENRITYIAFSLDAIKRLIKESPANADVYYLNGDLSPQELKNISASGADYEIHKFKEHPEWIKEIHDLGMKVNVWTVDKEEDMKFFIEQGVDFITTNEPVTLQKILQNNE